jgi:hypothetical protein
MQADILERGRTVTMEYQNNVSGAQFNINVNECPR